MTGQCLTPIPSTNVLTLVPPNSAPFASPFTTSRSGLISRLPTPTSKISQTNPESNLALPLSPVSQTSEMTSPIQLYIITTNILMQLDRLRFSHPACSSDQKQCNGKLCLILRPGSRDWAGMESEGRRQGGGSGGMVWVEWLDGCRK